MSKPIRSARLAAVTKASRTRAMSASVISRGLCQLSPNGIDEAAIVGQGSASGLSGPPPPQGQNTPQRRLIGIVVKSKATVRYAAVPFHMRRFHHHERSTRIRQHAVMHQMPIVGAAVVRRVLAHGGDHDAVGEL